MIAVNTVGEYPPRSKTTVHARSGPITARSRGSSRASSPARDAEGSAVTTSTGSPSASVTQVSSVAGPAIRIRAMCAFGISLVPV